MLMDYVPSDVDGVVVAGGRGTMLEVISGLLRRKDKALKADVNLLLFFTIKLFYRRDL
jgi:diacylglycerol kinase family enzyme